MLDVTGKHAGSLFLKNGMDRHQLFLLVYVIRWWFSLLLP
jgi:hypothetical protein